MEKKSKLLAEMENVDYDVIQKAYRKKLDDLKPKSVLKMTPEEFELVTFPIRTSREMFNWNNAIPIIDKFGLVCGCIPEVEKEEAKEIFIYITELNAFACEEIIPNIYAGYLHVDLEKKEVKVENRVAICVDGLKKERNTTTYKSKNKKKR